jgi:hypothetical protein
VTTTMTETTMLTDADLLARFEDASLQKEAFHHDQHVRAAWLFVRTYGMPDALGRFSTALKRFAATNGVPGLYHETISWAYLLLISERLARNPVGTWTEFATANPDLLSWKPSLVDRYYEPGTLASDLARRTFVMPDRVPSPCNSRG